MEEGRKMIIEAEVGRGKMQYTAVLAVDGSRAEREQGFSEAVGGWEGRGEGFRDRKKAGERVRGVWKWTKERREGPSQHRERLQQLYKQDA